MHKKAITETSSIRGEAERKRAQKGETLDSAQSWTWNNVLCAIKQYVSANDFDVAIHALCTERQLLPPPPSLASLFVLHDKAVNDYATFSHRFEGGIIIIV